MFERDHSHARTTLAAWVRCGRTRFQITHFLYSKETSIPWQNDDSHRTLNLYQFFELQNDQNAYLSQTTNHTSYPQGECTKHTYTYSRAHTHQKKIRWVVQAVRGEKRDTTHTRCRTHTHPERLWCPIGWLWLEGSLNYRSVLQNIFSFIGFFCKRHL